VDRSFPGILEQCDVSNTEQLTALIEKHKVEVVYHLAALLSSTGENNPALAFDLNLVVVKNILELAVKYKFQMFFASTIGIFNNEVSPSVHTPQHTVIEPKTMYGVTK